MLLRGHPMLDAGGALPASQQRLTQVHPAPSTCQRLVGALHSTRAEHHQHLIRKWGAASPHRGGTTVTKALADLPLPAPAPPPPVPAPAPAPLSVSVQAPGPNYNNIANLGAAKAAMPAWKTLLSGTLAGVFIAYGGFLILSVGGSIPGIAAANPGLQKLIMGLVFPVCLLLVQLCGADLYTGNTAFVSVAVLEGKATVKQAMKHFLFSYAGNYIGSFLMAGAVAASGVLATNSLPLAMTVAKTSLDWQIAFIRAVLCNWLVCCAVWMAASATSLPGKAVACWPPLTAFIAIGLEHSIANMFLISLGINMGANVTWAQMWTSNLIPVTLGNTVAGMLCMALPYALLFGSLGNKITALTQKRTALA